MFKIKRINFLFYNICLLLVGFLFCLNTAICRAEMIGESSRAEYSEEINLLVGELKTIAANSPSRLSVADPSVADIDKATTQRYIL